MKPHCYANGKQQHPESGVKHIITGWPVEPDDIVGAYACNKNERLVEYGIGNSNVNRHMKTAQNVNLYEGEYEASAHIYSNEAFIRKIGVPQVRHWLIVVPSSVRWYLHDDE